MKCFWILCIPVMMMAQGIPWDKIKDSGVRLALRTYSESFVLSSTNLRFEGYTIVDVRFFTNLMQVRRLSLYNNRIEDVSPLSVLTNLVYLNLGKNRLKDVSSLSNLVGLEVLILHDNVEITNVRGVHKIPTLRELDLRNTHVYHNSLKTWAFTNTLGIYDREGQYHEIPPAEKEKWGIYNSMVVPAWY
ncbi:MAG: leucine-rich repeat domain-containing protein [Brevinematales bacterium]|nr:leucine-rich repeat domain-containing protein [Brevinematales bacterium]